MTAHHTERPVALITGATRGIGRATALALARSNAVVIGTATSAAGVEAINAAFAQSGVEGRGALLDVRDQEACKILLADIQAREGAPSIVVNNAGITRDNLALRMKDDEWFAVIDTHLTAAFRLCRLTMHAMMKRRWGRIINITSVVAHSGNPGQANYCAAKAGVAGMTRALAYELGPRNITVNCVAPGFIDTDMTHALPQAQRDALLSRIPLGRSGTAEDVAAAVAFLASSSAAYITGSTLHVNGGMMML
jgi:3-oxoacyl-[acyl-carrier protein] reductase